MLLLVDDDDDIRRAVTKYVTGAMPNVHVVASASGKDGLDILLNEPIDLILTDYRMPQMNGLEFLEQAKRIKPRVPRIMLTAYPDMELAKAAVNEENVLRFLTKPIDPDALVRVIREVIESIETREAQLKAIEQQLGHRS